jgi:predicted dehydrogenase
MSKINIAVIGCGKHFEDFHLPSFKRLKRFIFITGIFDINLKRAKYISKKYKIEKIYNSISDLLKDKNVNTVDICSPPAFHFKQIIDAIKFKKNIIVEKPFVLKESQINKIINLSKKTNLKIMCLQHSRFRVETKKFCKFLNQKRRKFGKLFLIEAVANYSNGIPKQINNSFTDIKISGGGPLLDHGSHLLDLVLFFFNFDKYKIKSSFFFKNFFKKKNIVYNVEEMAIVHALFNKKILLKFETSYLSHKKKDNFYINFHFENGFLTWPTLEYKLNNIKNFIKFKNKQKASDVQFSHFVDCVVNNKNPAIDLLDIKKLVILIEKFYKNGIYISNYDKSNKQMFIKKRS